MLDNCLVRRGGMTTAARGIYMKKMTTFIPLFVAALLVGVDRYTKYLVLEGLKSKPDAVILKGILNFTYCVNDGAAFSVLKGKIPFLIVITSLFIIAIIILLLMGKVKDKFLIWSLALICAGGVGNLIDRILQGYVVDFIKVTFINFPIFNFADICAVTGTFMFMFYIFFIERAKNNDS